MNNQPKNIDLLGFADIHCHMLAGIDDGAQTVEEMTEMVRLAQNKGTDLICFTPHSGIYGNDTDPEKIKTVFSHAIPYLKEKFPNMKFYLGSEVFYSCDIPEKLKNGTYLPINGSRYVLVEFSTGTDFFNIKSGVKFITMAGYVPVLAHIERYKSVYPNQEAIAKLKKMGAVIQVNSRHVSERNIWGFYKIKPLIKRGLIDLVSSDCHDTERRTPDMLKCYEFLSQTFGKKHADLLMKINPRLILANKSIRKSPF